MIASNIKKDVRYIVTNSIDKTDLDNEAIVYNAKIYNKHIKFVLGAPKFEYLSSGAFINRMSVLLYIEMNEAGAGI
jgi:hypothetical protein